MTFLAGHLFPSHLCIDVTRVNLPLGFEPISLAWEVDDQLSYPSTFGGHYINVPCLIVLTFRWSPLHLYQTVIWTSTMITPALCLNNNELENCMAFYSKSVVKAAPFVWNAISIHIHQIQNEAYFKQRPKIYHFKLATNLWTI